MPNTIYDGIYHKCIRCQDCNRNAICQIKDDEAFNCHNECKALRNENIELRRELKHKERQLEAWQTFNQKYIEMERESRYE